MITRGTRLITIALAAFAVSGCVSYSMFQGPEVVEQGQLTAMAGAAAAGVPGDSADEGGLEGPLPEVGLRYGLGGGFDASVKVAGIPPFGTFYGDVRWQVLSAPWPVTAGLGGSYVSIGDEPDRLSFSALYPSLAVGTDRLWVAGRGIIVAAGSAEDIFLSGGLWGLVAGTSFGGGALRVLPEVEVYFGPDDILYAFGAAFQLDLLDPDGDG